MVDIYFLKDKERTATKEPDAIVNIQDIISSFGVAELKFLQADHITITRKHTTEYNSYVALYVSQDEAGAFPEGKAGFYVLKNIKPEDFPKTLLQI